VSASPPDQNGSAGLAEPCFGVSTGFVVVGVVVVVA